MRKQKLVREIDGTACVAELASDQGFMLRVHVHFPSYNSVWVDLKKQPHMQMGKVVAYI